MIPAVVAAIALMVAEPASATGQAPAPTATSNQATKAPSQSHNYPRLVIAGGPLLGPHTFGNELCREQSAQCQTTGTFFGLGAQAELRGQLWRPLYLHVRTLVTGNVSPRERVHRGLWGLGLGLGAYGRHVFGRAEYLFVDTFGSDRFARPFGDAGVGRDVWGYHAGLLSLGARLRLHPRLHGELWGGWMIGPHSKRMIPDEPVDNRTLMTFLIGINVSYDLLLGRSSQRE